MPVPGVSVNISNGNLGGVNFVDDSITGIILSGIALTDWPLGTVKVIYSLEQAEDAGIDKTVVDTSFAHREIREFYDKAGSGQELHVMLVADTTQLAFACDKVNPMLMKLLQESGGRIKRWGANIAKPNDYVPVLTKGIDQDVLDAATKAQELTDALALNYIFTRGLLPGRDYQGAASLDDLTQRAENRVGICLLGDNGNKEARIGFTLGCMAANSVQRKIGAVEDGHMGLNECYLTDGTTKAKEITDVQNTIYDKGYILPIVRPGRAGYFFAGDPTATSRTDDYHSFVNGFVIDKACRIAYDVYLSFVNTDYEKEPDGSIGMIEQKRLQGNIDDRVKADMAGEISGFKSLVDPADQPGNGVTKIALAVQPRGYHETIQVEIGMTNAVE
ncbi:MAG: hypothetical protein JEZ14_15095 [Marinilabiliaceae bacterium]|nr:hypothetical protein [Marinilabiliaceae bacterium]